MASLFKSLPIHLFHRVTCEPFICLSATTAGEGKQSDESTGINRITSADSWRVLFYTLHIDRIDQVDTLIYTRSTAIWKCVCCLLYKRSVFHRVLTRLIYQEIIWIHVYCNWWSLHNLIGDWHYFICRLRHNSEKSDTLECNESWVLDIFSILHCN
jgi:hypothetical protein